MYTVNNYYINETKGGDFLATALKYITFVAVAVFLFFSFAPKEYRNTAVEYIKIAQEESSTYIAKAFDIFYKYAEDPNIALTGIYSEQVKFESTDLVAVPVTRQIRQDIDDRRIGVLSARYESRGSYSVIGRDNTGGWSYGKYQIATKTGTMRNFIRWMKPRNKKYYNRLIGAGGALGATKGTKMFTSEWRSLARESRFNEMQHKFISDTHYLRLVLNLKRSTGYDVTKTSFAMKNVAWSTAVQHGGGNSKHRTGGPQLFERAIKRLNRSDIRLTERNIIKAVYALRKNCFSSSTPRVRKAVKERFVNEERQAIQMLQI